MSKRKPVVVMSWAMRQNREVEAVTFAEQLVELLGDDQNIEKILLPSMAMLYPVSSFMEYQYTFRSAKHQCLRIRSIYRRVFN